MSLIKWLERRRKKRNREIAIAVGEHLQGMGHSWEQFLPPVAVRDCLYMTTKSGKIYRLNCFEGTGLELITEIPTHF